MSAADMKAAPTIHHDLKASPVVPKSSNNAVVQEATESRHRRRHDSPAPKVEAQKAQTPVSDTALQKEDLRTSVPKKQEYIRIPLSDYVLDLKTANKLVSSAQTREKSLKILQYIVKFMVYAFQHWYVVHTWAKTVNQIAKNISKARRFFKFFRWLKHLEDVKDAQAEKSGSTMHMLMWTSIYCNMFADISEDVCSLQRLNFLPAGTLPPWADLYANYCQLVLAVIEIVLYYAKAKRETEKAKKDGGSGAGGLESFRKMRMAQLEFSKFISDLGKAFWDCEFSWASELLFIFCGFYSAIVSTHKFLLKALKASGPPPGK
eukprot:gnl/MRDRNA2_/MRDRNA2_240359_c0_seq1.p1 gnl/MRDRNA2_/MRDRNA2_240359_c0~~gnl/MRDRNA2_/MRDRNA2_240359_c0_seq1.p1  ORF type:complete len:319 (-),score=72.41 gnl/MRDRNA2_/MRDRNA2_240359_c0_seq1:98-1054(-)